MIGQKIKLHFHGLGGWGVMAPKNKNQSKISCPRGLVPRRPDLQKLARYKILIGAISLTPTHTGVIITSETHDRVPIGEELEKHLGAVGHDTIVFLHNLDSLGLHVSEEELAKGIDSPIVHDLEVPVGSVQPEELGPLLHHPMLLEGPVGDLQA